MESFSHASYDKIKQFIKTFEIHQDYLYVSGTFFKLFMSSNFKKRTSSK